VVRDFQIMHAAASQEAWPEVAPEGR
jgi:hypothetical protein